MSPEQRVDGSAIRETTGQPGRRNIILLGVVSFLNDFGSEMIMPILPMFVRSLGGGGLAIGLLSGLRDGVSSILQVLSGYLSDRTGKRKIFIVVGYALSAVFKLVLAASRTSTQAMVFSASERVGKGLRSAAKDAIVADSARAERGKGFGIVRALDTAGAVCGSASAFLLFQFLGFGFKTIIIVAAFLSLVSLVPLRFVKEPAEAVKVVAESGRGKLPKSLMVFIIISSVFALGNFGYMFFVIRAQDSLGGGLKVAAPILLYVLYNIFYAAFAVPLGVMSDKIGRDRVIMIGYLLFFATNAGFAMLHSLPAFLVLFALYGVAFAAVDGNQRAFISDLAGKGSRATALGVFQTVSGSAALAAGLVAGLLWEKVNPVATFVYGALFTMAAALLLLLQTPGHSFDCAQDGRDRG